jgi:hypothetical protein
MVGNLMVKIPVFTLEKSRSPEVKDLPKLWPCALNPALPGLPWI